MTGRVSGSAIPAPRRAAVKDATSVLVPPASSTGGVVDGDAKESLPERWLLTMQQAADRLQISRSALYREVRAGRLKIVKLGNLTRVRPDSLEAYIREQEVEGLR